MAKMAMPQLWHGRPARGFGPGIYVTYARVYRATGKPALSHPFKPSW